MADATDALMVQKFLRRTLQPPPQLYLSVFVEPGGQLQLCLSDGIGHDCSFLKTAISAGNPTQLLAEATRAMLAICEYPERYVIAPAA